MSTASWVWGALRETRTRRFIYFEDLGLQSQTLPMQGFATELYSQLSLHFYFEAELYEIVWDHFGLILYLGHASNLTSLPQPFK